MTDTLLVTLEGPPLDGATQAELEQRCRDAARTAFPPATANELRLWFRDAPFGTTIEPFHRGRALQAMLHLPKQRSDAGALLRLLVTCARPFTKRVGVMLAREDAPLPAERVDVQLAELGQALRVGTWYRIV